MYVLDQHDEHTISADPEQDLVTLCVFNPPCKGTENHKLGSDASGY